MNRNMEWESFLNEIKKNLPPRIEFSAQNALTRKRRNKKKAIIITTPVAGAIIFVVTFSILENVSPKFADVMSKVPLARQFARLVSIRKCYS